MIEIPDIDLDVKDRDKVAGLFPKAVVASQVQQGNMVPHKNGLYFQKIPVCGANGLAAFPYKEAEERGYFKVDLLPNHVYDLIESPEELDELLEAPVDWDWFLDYRFYEKKLFHLGRHHELCLKYPPRSVQDVAVLISVIRPSRRHLLEENLSWGEISARVWQKDASGQYGFKKSHAIGYAIVTVLHAKLIARHFATDDWE